MNKIKNLLAIIYRYFNPISKVEMYKRMGVEIGHSCKFQFDVIIDFSHFWHVKIGNNVTLAPRVHILAHDASTVHSLGYAKIGNVNIGNNVFIGAGSIILPGVNIGNDVIIGAGSVVTKSIENNSVCVGNPAKYICSYSSYIEKQKQILDEGPKFEEIDTLRKGVTPERQKEMQVIVEEAGYGFIR